MADQECPKCGTIFPDDAGWANSAVSTLIIAPAVQDMATQVRCPHCQHRFAESEIRHLWSSRTSGSAAAFWLIVAALLVWAVYRLIGA